MLALVLASLVKTRIYATIHKKAIEQFMWHCSLYKVILTFKFVDDAKVCGHSDESCLKAVLQCGTVHCTRRF